ncbi:MAG: MtnX-like HAD-IB family phosphatase [Chloroflexi bacterium]|nr:MtnX-like HAD-IB family phosphatase [Chloroflexota bacterium]
MVILCDFDGTVVEQNVADVLLSTFAKEAWERLRAQFRAGLINLREYSEGGFSSIQVDKETLMDSVQQKVTLRPYFHELVELSRERAIPLVVVSHGMDFYLEAAFQKFGLAGIHYLAVQATFSPSGMKFHYPLTSETCKQYGNCKCLLLERYQGEGHKVIYIGDGPPDRCPAEKADYIFATRRLLTICQERGLPHTEFSDFRDVTKGIEKIIARENND